MMDQDFYAFFPSNASFNLYPQNKTSNFKVQLAQRIQLQGSWQAALVELHYPNTIQHVAEGKNEFSWTFCLHDQLDNGNCVYDLYTTYDRLKPDQLAYNVWNTVQVEKKYYHSGNELIRDLTHQLESFTTAPTVKLSDEGIVSIELIQPSHVFVKFSPSLALQLGFLHPGPYKINTEPLRGVRPINIFLGYPTQLYVYFDKLAEQIVGDTNVPLLRAVPTILDEQYGTIQVERFDQPIYFDLNTKCFDTVQVDIRDETGRLVPFTHGTSMVVVHFRRKA